MTGTPSKSKWKENRLGSSGVVMLALSGDTVTAQDRGDQNVVSRLYLTALKAVKAKMCALLHMTLDWELSLMQRNRRASYSRYGIK